MNKMMKKALSLVLTVSATVGIMSGCSTTTKNPEVEMELVYEGKTYTLEYTLSRSAAPATVEHFIKLVENKYYDGLCVHDYVAEEKMYTGGYTYDDGLKYKSYYDAVKGYANFPTSVWADYEKNQPLYTLRGEFSANDFYVGDKNNSGALKESFGALSMYYTEKKSEDSVYVYNGTTEKMQIEDYAHNSATSLFTIALEDSTSVNKNYCTFATLNEDSVSVLEDLIELIEEDEEATEEVEMDVDFDDSFEKEYGNSVTYNVLKSALVIKSVKVTKY